MSQKKDVYTRTVCGDREFWTRIGSGLVNKDGTITVKLEALPVGDTLVIRDTPTTAQEARK